MRQSIADDKAKVLRRYGRAPRHTFEVDFYPYKELIEREMRR